MGSSFGLEEKGEKQRSLHRGVAVELEEFATFTAFDWCPGFACNINLRRVLCDCSFWVGAMGGACIMELGSVDDDSARRVGFGIWVRCCVECCFSVHG